MAIVYLKGAGQSALTAAGLEVAPSLYAFLKRLKAEGYTVENIPATEKEFEALLQREGSIFGSYAKGKMAEFMATAIRNGLIKPIMRDGPKRFLPRRNMQKS